MSGPLEEFLHHQLSQGPQWEWEVFPGGLQCSQQDLDLSVWVRLAPAPGPTSGNKAHPRPCPPTARFDACTQK